MIPLSLHIASVFTPLKIFLASTKTLFKEDHPEVSNVVSGLGQRVATGFPRDIVCKMLVQD
jgi:hypothetical protein